MILGIKWMESIGRFTINFKTMTFKFKINGERINLKGLLDEITQEKCSKIKYGSQKKCIRNVHNPLQRQVSKILEENMHQQTNVGTIFMMLVKHINRFKEAVHMFFKG